jgi:hypothetical protein
MQYNIKFQLWEVNYKKMSFLCLLLSSVRYKYGSHRDYRDNRVKNYYYSVCLLQQQEVANCDHIK